MHPRPQLVDHLLVELADASARRPRLAFEEDGEQAAVRFAADGGVGDAADELVDFAISATHLSLRSQLGLSIDV